MLHVAQILEPADDVSQIWHHVNLAEIQFQLSLVNLSHVKYLIDEVQNTLCISVDTMISRLALWVIVSSDESLQW